MRRDGLRDDQWARIQDLLPGRVGPVGVTAKDNRLFVEVVLYRYRAGIPWRDLPQCFGDWKKVHTRFGHWTRSGVWELLLISYGYTRHPRRLGARFHPGKRPIRCLG